MTNTVDQQKSRNLGCLYAAIVLISFFACSVLVVRHDQQQIQHSREIRRANHRAEVVSEVMAGDSSVVIDDLELLRLLAQNPRCTSTIERITFTMMTFDSEVAKFAGQFKKLRNLGFYDCHGADCVIVACSELPVEELFFETTAVSDDQLASLQNFKSLRKVRFEQIVDSRQAEILQQLPSTVTIEIPFPEEIEPQE